MPSPLLRPAVGILLFCMISGPGQASGNRLPDGETARFEGDKGFWSAWYEDPTSRYRHAILGDAVEAGALAVEHGEQIYRLTLPEDQVFEDRTPRLADLDGDGSPEIITIRSYQTDGGSVAVFGLKNGAIAELANSRPIGRANRWLNIAGIDDYAGLGRPQVAFVETPHIGGTLYITEWRGQHLVPIASMAGFSNHRIGAREQDLTATLNYNVDGRPDLIVPSDSRTVLRIVGFENGSFSELGTVRLPSEVRRHMARPDLSQSDCAEFELHNDAKIAICPQS